MDAKGIGWAVAGGPVAHLGQQTPLALVRLVLSEIVDDGRSQIHQT